MTKQWKQWHCIGIRNLIRACWAPLMPLLQVIGMFDFLTRHSMFFSSHNSVLFHCFLSLWSNITVELYFLCPGWSFRTMLLGRFEGAQLCSSFRILGSLSSQTKKNESLLLRCFTFSHESWINWDHSPDINPVKEMCWNPNIPEETAV